MGKKGQTTSFEPDEGSVDHENFGEQLSVAPIDVGHLSMEEQALFAEAQMGQDAIDIMNSDVGRVIRSMIKYDVRGKTATLVSVPWWRQRKIRALQNDIRNGESFLSYIADIIERGEMAYLQLSERDD